MDNISDLGRNLRQPRSKNDSIHSSRHSNFSQKSNKNSQRGVHLTKQKYEAITAHYKDDPKAKAIAEDIGKRMGLLIEAGTLNRENSDGSVFSDITSDSFFPSRRNSDAESVLSHLADDTSIGPSPSHRTALANIESARMPLEDELERQITEQTNLYLESSDIEGENRDLDKVHAFIGKLKTFGIQEKTAVLRALKDAPKEGDANLLSSYQQEALVEIMYPDIKSDPDDSTL